MKKLKLIMAFCALLLGWSNASAQGWRASEVAAGDYYLYNVGAAAYLSNGAKWNTHAVLSVDQGIVVNLTKVSDGVYTIGTNSKYSGKYFNSNGYVDSGTESWTFEEVPGMLNTYKIKTSGGSYAYATTGLYNVMIGNDTGDSKSYWKLVTNTNRSDANVASSLNPVDWSYLIKNPRFDQLYDSNSKKFISSKDWTGENTQGGNYVNKNYDAGGDVTELEYNTHNPCVERWHKTTDFYQELTSLPNGKYIVKCQAFYKADGGSSHASYLYANNENTELILKTGDGDPNSMVQASNHFSTNEYWNSITVNVTNGSLKIGVKTDDTNNWMIWDNFQLYYCGNDCSSSITNAGFDNNTGWTGLGSVSNSEVEYWGGNDAQKTFDLYQDLTGLTAGIYAVEAQGFYRNGAGIDEKRAKANESMLATLYAKGQDGTERNTTLQSIYSEAGKLTNHLKSLFGDIPNYMNHAQDYISAGYYNDNKVIVEVGNEGTLRIGAKKGTAVSADWTILDNFSLTKLDYSTLTDAYAAEWTARKTSAQALLNNGDYSNIVSGSTQRTALSSAVSATPSDLAGYISALAALRTAVNNFKAAKYAYDLYATNAAAATEAYNAEGTTYVNVTGDEKTTFNTAYATNVSGFSPATNNAENYYNAAVAIGSATDAFTNETVKNNYNEYAAEVATATLLGTDVSGVATPTTSSAALTAAHSINVLNYNKVVAEEYEDVSGSTLGAWTDNNVGERSGQHWDGTNGSKYFEMDSGWGNTSWNMSRTQNVSLSAGKYILKVACRVSTSANATLSVTVGGSTISTISGHQGDTGKGITTSGVASYDEGAFANTNGRGFEWKYIPFELDETGSVTLSFTAEGHAQYQFVSFTSLALLTDPKVAARTSLLNKINEATSARKATNEGTGIFQIPAAAGTTLGTAISTAQGVYDDEDADLSEITGATTTLNTAIGTYEATELNAPDAEKRYVLTLDGKGALTFKTASTEGGYGMPFMTANVNLAQAFMFEAVSGNTYKLYFYDLDGNKRYICTRADYGTGGTGTYGIRTATDKPLEILMQATATEGVFNMLNTQCDNKKLGSNGGDFYTDDAYTNWTIAEAAQAEVAINIASDVKYATRIFPFTPVLPSGVVAYSCEASSDNVLTLEEVANPAANTPYILYAESGYSGDALTGWGIASATSYTEGWLTGVYEDTKATAGTYVLQNNDKVAFYKVVENEEPTVGANRCYLTIPAAPAQGAREAFFFPGGVTSINAVNAIEALTSGKAQIFNASGAQIPALQKGLNIIRMEDGTTQKVVVK